MRQETGPPVPGSRRRSAAAALVAALVVLLVAAALVSGRRRLEDRSHSWTSNAAWIWYARAGRQPRPLRFFAARDVAISEVPALALARFLVDPRYSLYLNGRKVSEGSGRPGDSLAAADLAPYLRPGINRIVIEASSPDGVGGILFNVEGEGLDPDEFASSSRWRVGLDRDALERGEGRPAIVWGRPPQYPWGYPRPPSR